MHSLRPRSSRLFLFDPAAFCVEAVLPSASECLVTVVTYVLCLMCVSTVRRFGHRIHAGAGEKKTQASKICECDQTR